MAQSLLSTFHILHQHLSMISFRMVSIFPLSLSDSSFFIIKFDKSPESILIMGLWFTKKSKAALFITCSWIMYVAHGILISLYFLYYLVCFHVQLTTPKIDSYELHNALHVHVGFRSVAPTVNQNHRCSSHRDTHFIRDIQFGAWQLLDSCVSDSDRCDRWHRVWSHVSDSWDLHLCGIFLLSHQQNMFTVRAPASFCQWTFRLQLQNLPNCRSVGCVSFSHLVTGQRLYKFMECITLFSFSI